jgi:hypothetical protein
VGRDQRQRAGVAGVGVDEVDIEDVDLPHELRQGVRLRLWLAPVTLGALTEGWDGLLMR